jgi:alpha-amylase
MHARLAIRLLTIEAGRSLARNKVRSGLAILGVTVAVATVIWVVAIGRAARTAAEAELDKLGDNLVWIDQSAVAFEVDNATTFWGQNAYVVGDAPQLAGWSPSGALQMNPTAYPSWTRAVMLPRNTTVSFKFIERDGGGNTKWMNGANLSFTIPDAASSSFRGSWQ